MKLSDMIAIAAKRTPGEWVAKFYLMTWGVYPAKDADKGMGLLEDPSAEDAAFITMCANNWPAIEKVLVAAKELRIFLDEDVGMDKPQLTELRAALAELEKERPFLKELQDLDKLIEE